MSDGMVLSAWPSQMVPHWPNMNAPHETQMELEEKTVRHQVLDKLKVEGRKC